MKFRALLGTFLLTLFNGLGTILFVSESLYFKILGIIWITVCFFTTFLVVNVYMESDYFKNLGDKK